MGATGPTGPTGATGPSFITAFAANNRFLQYHTTFDQNKTAYLEPLIDCELLVIDDLGAERDTDFALEKVYNVVDSRYRAKRPIILTTNLSMEEMKENLDIRYTRIYDRIFEMCYPMQFKGLSWRKGEAARRYNDTKSFLEGDDG